MLPTPLLNDFRNDAANRRNEMKNSLIERQAKFNAAHPNLIDNLRSLANWNEFAASLVSQFEIKGDLSDRQIAVGQNQVDKAAARDAARIADRTARIENAPVIDMTSIEAMFERARLSGLNKLAFVAADLRISPAKASSVNAGALYIQRDGIYQGKVKDGKFLAVREALPDTASILAEIAVNPSQAARDYGKRTGKCCCCGRELTDPESIANGIGPICATKWEL